MGEFDDLLKYLLQARSNVLPVGLVPAHLIDARIRSRELVEPDQAQSGSLLLKMQSGYRVATRINSDIELDISGLVVRATLRQTFRNDGDNWVEGVYVFPLSETAAVDRMRFTVGERVIEGEVQEKEKAKAEYEKAKREGKRTSLVNQQRANLFTTRLANIGPGETINIEIEYLDTAKYEDGTFSLRIPTTLTPRYIPGAPVEDRQGSGWAADTDRVPDASLITPPQVVNSGDHRLSLRASINAGMPLKFVASRYHPIDVAEADGSYRLQFSLAGTKMDHDIELLWRPVDDERPRALAFAEQNGEQQHVLIMLVPPTLPEAPSSVVARELTFVIDTSGSMHGVSIEQAKQALLLALDGLRPIDRFKIRVIGPATPGIPHILAYAAVLHIAGLRHKAVDHPVKDDIRVGALFGQLHDPGHMARGNIFEKINDNRALSLARNVNLETGGKNRCGEQAEDCGEATHRPPP